MISKALRGRDVAGLLRYLFGPGRANEHTNRRIVASSDPTWTGTQQPDKVTLRQLADEMHDSVRRHGDGTKDGYVYHVAISLAADDQPLTDTQWQHVAQRFADKLGLDDHVSWLAVNHGHPPTATTTSTSSSTSSMTTPAGRNCSPSAGCGAARRASSSKTNLA